VVLEERSPGLRGWLRAARHETRNGPLRNLEAELEQLTMNARGTPEKIGVRHGADEVRKIRTPIEPKHATQSACDATWLVRRCRRCAPSGRERSPFATTAYVFQTMAESPSSTTSPHTVGGIRDESERLAVFVLATLLIPVLPPGRAFAANPQGQGDNQEALRTAMVLSFLHQANLREIDMAGIVRHDPTLSRPSPLRRPPISDHKR